MSACTVVLGRSGGLLKGNDWFPSRSSLYKLVSVRSLVSQSWCTTTVVVVEGVEVYLLFTWCTEVWRTLDDWNWRVLNQCFAFREILCGRWFLFGSVFSLFCTGGYCDCFDVYEAHTLRGVWYVVNRCFYFFGASGRSKCEILIVLDFQLGEFASHPNLITTWLSVRASQPILERHYGVFFLTRYLHFRAVINLNEEIFVVDMGPFWDCRWLPTVRWMLVGQCLKCEFMKNNHLVSLKNYNSKIFGGFWIRLRHYVDTTKSCIIAYQGGCWRMSLLAQAQNSQLFSARWYHVSFWAHFGLLIVECVKWLHCHHHSFG